MYYLVYTLKVWCVKLVLLKLFTLIVEVRCVRKFTLIQSCLLCFAVKKFTLSKLDVWPKFYAKNKIMYVFNRPQFFMQQFTLWEFGMLICYCITGLHSHHKCNVCWNIFFKFNVLFVHQFTLGSLVNRKMLKS